MGTCKCNQIASVIRSDLYVPNIEIEPKQSNVKKLMRLHTNIDNKAPESSISNLKASAEKFIREKSSLFKTVISKDCLIDKARIKKYHHTYIDNTSSSKKNINDYLNKEKNIKCDFTEKNWSTKEAKMIAKILLHHFFFYKATSTIMNYLLDEINEFSINANALLFNENDEGSCMFIIKSGQVELSHSSSSTTKILSDEGIFGELAIVQKNTKRNYNARTITELYCYMIEESVFSTVAEELLGQRKYHLPFLEYIDSDHRESLELFVIELDFKKGHCINDLNEIFGVVEGKLKVLDRKGNTLSSVTPNEIFGMNILMQIGSDNREENDGMHIVVEEDSKCFVLPFKAFIEVFGLNFQHKLLFSYFKCSMLKNKFFAVLCNEANMNKLFILFKVVPYAMNQTVNSASASSQRKVMILLDGELIYVSSKRKAVLLGQVYGEANLCEEENKGEDIIAAKPSVVFECEWESFTTKAMMNNIPYNELMASLSQMYLVNSFTEKELFKLGTHINRVSFKEDEVIIKGDQPQDKYYFSQRGIVKQVNNQKVIRYYYPNNSFGEIYLLNDKEDGYDIIASSKNVTLLSLSKDIFFNLLGNPYLNSLIRTKLTNENTEIYLPSLFNLSTLHKGRRSNVYLVHNKLSLYAVKAIQLSDKNRHFIPNIINEKKVSMHLDHPFVIQYVKTLKTHKWCFFIKEYSYGITLDEYLEMNDPFEDKDHLQFYGGSLFVILNYFRTIGVIHRDIMLSNIIIDTSGYIKLIDFGSSKIVRNDLTKTIIGTPMYIAPEVLGGKGYSYSCDYWSVGVCLYYIFYGWYPFGEKAEVPGDVYKEILNKKLNFKNEPEEDNKDVHDLLNQLLNKNPGERSIEHGKIKKCSIFSDFNWEKLIRRKLSPPFLPQVVKFNQQQVFQNCSNPFQQFMDGEKLGDYCSSLVRLNKEVVLGVHSDERTIEQNWFNEF